MRCQAATALKGCVFGPVFYTGRLRSTAAPMKAANSECGSNVSEDALQFHAFAQQ